MEKIWIVKQGRHLRLCKTEREMLRRTSIDGNQEILEFTLTSQCKASDYFKTRERDSQLKSILGELDKSEQNIIDFIALYEQIAPDGRKNTWSNKTEKDTWLGKLKKYQGDKKGFAALLINDKKYFFTISDSVEWMKAILLVHNFNNHIYDKPKSIWDSVNRKYIYEHKDTASEELKKNFLLAKEQIKKDKKPAKKKVAKAV